MSSTYPCSQCAKTYSHKYTLSKHVRQCHTDDASFACKTCSHRSMNATNMAVHQLTHTGERPYQCDECDKTYPTLCRLRAHITQVHSSDSKYVCITCGHRAYNRSTLLLHMRRHTDEQPFKCLKCPKIFRQAGGLSGHVRKEHTESKKYQCSECGHRAMAKTALRIHMRRLHSGEKPYTCDECDAKFATRSQVNVHKMYSHVPDEVSRVHECKQCGQCFKRSAALNDHVLYRHDHPDVRPFKCTKCDKAFKTEKDHHRHQLVHSEARPFVCAFDGCDKSFKTNGLLCRHQKIHDGVTRYKCPECDYRSDRKPSMRRHYKSKHPGCDFTDVHQ